MIGNFYVLDNALSVVQVFNQEGRFLFMFGQQGTGNGQISNSYCLTVDNAITRTISW